jgi:hypothetical protein
MSQGRYVSGELVRSVYVVNMSSGGGSGTPGGSNTQIQFNNAGVFGGVANSSVNNATGNITLGSRVSVPLGTAALPSIYPGTDTNTGIYSPGADQLAVATNGTGRLFINATGNVGIGTTSPSNLLDVASTVGDGIRIGASPAGTITRESEGLRITGVSTNKNISFVTAGTEACRIDTSGRLLVGTSSDFTNGTGTKLQTIDPSGGQLAIGRNTDTVNTGNLVGRIRWYSNVGGTSEETARIATEADGNYALGDKPSRLVFSTTADGASSPTERLRIDSSGNVGIGTTDPADELHINASSANVNLRLTRDTDTGVRITGTDSTSPAFIIETISSGTATERARIDSSGRLLVGTSTSIAVGGANGSNIQLAGSAALQSQSRWVANTGGPSFILGKSRSATPGSYTIVQDDDGLGTITFAGDDGTDLQSVAARIQGFVDGTPGANDMPGRLVFSTTAQGASTPTERMRITSDAYVRLAAGTGGIQFNGDTAAANALDDYEDGTWTPIFVPQTGSFNSITYDSTRAGNYTKVGNLVTVWGIIRTDSVDATGASGLLAIGGLPFSVGTGTTGGGFAVNLLNWAGEYPSSVRPSVGETFAYLGYRTAIDGNDTISNVSDLTTGTGDANRLAFQFSYRV